MKSIRFTAVTAVAATATLLLTGCGYDPGTVEDGGERRQEIEESREAGAEESDRQMSAHLLADAHALAEVSTTILENPDTPDDVSEIADRVQVLASGQIGALPEEYEEGGVASIDPAEITGAADPAVAYTDMLESELPRLRSAWSNLEDAGNETLANTARMSVEEIESIQGML